MARPGEGNPLRTGIFGIALVACLVLVSFGYTGLPFWPQGKDYEAYFTDAGGITPGNDVNVSGIKVGKVDSIELAGDSAKVNFTVDRKRQGRRPVAGRRSRPTPCSAQKSLAVTPKGAGSSTVIPLGRTTTPYTLNTALQDLGQNAGELDKPKFEQALQTLTDTLHDATPQLRGALDGVAEPVAQPQQARRGARTTARATPRRCPTRWRSAPVRSTSSSPTATSCSPHSTSAARR